MTDLLNYSTEVLVENDYPQLSQSLYSSDSSSDSESSSHHNSLSHSSDSTSSSDDEPPYIEDICDSDLHPAGCYIF